MRDSRKSAQLSGGLEADGGEFRALCYQAFNIATLQLDCALARQSDGDKPLAVITDMDDTILHANDYWALLIERNRDFSDDGIWDDWIPKNRVTAVPGALDMQRCKTGRADRLARD